MAKLSRRYATAFFELAVERGLLKLALIQVQSIKTIFEDEKIYRFIVYPGIPKKEKCKIIEGFYADLFGDESIAELKSLIALLIEKNRETIIKNVLEDFLVMANKFLGEVKVVITSAAPMNVKTEAQLKNALSLKIGKHVLVGTEINQDLLGGVYVSAEDFIIDGSVKGGLNELKDFIINKKSGGNEQPLHNQEGLLS